MQSSETKRHLKTAVVKLLRAAPLRMLTSLMMLLVGGLGRFWAQAKLRALIPSAGPNCMCHASATLKLPDNIKLGDYVWIGQDVLIGAHSTVTIEDHVRISQGAVIETAGVDFTLAPPYPHVSRPVTIKRGVWLATNCVILGGVTIGEYAVIGAGAVVTHDVEPYTVVASSPGRRVTFAPNPVATRDPEDT
jgi:maltose O-acetyltransferase